MLNALARLKVAKLLDGFRGQPAGDIKALIDVVLIVADLAEEYADALLELEVNPVIVRPEGKGVVIADALIRCLPGSKLIK